MTLFKLSSICKRACCHVKLLCYAPCKCSVNSSWLRCCSFLYTYLISCLIRYFTACCVVFRSLVVSPVVCRMLYFGSRPLVLHILLNQMAAFVFNIFIFVYLMLLCTFLYCAVNISFFVAAQYYQINLKIPSNCSLFNTICKTHAKVRRSNP